MSYTVKPVTQEQNGYYELFTTGKATWIDWTEVDVLQSIGRFSIEDLNREKEQYEKNIAEVQLRIDAINNVLNS